MPELAEIYDEVNKIGANIYIFPCGNCDACTIEQQGIYDIFVDPTRNTTTATTKATIMHEWGHCKTGSTHTLHSKFESIGKNEEKANREAFKRFLPFDKIKKAANSGLTEYWQLAEHFNLDESFIRQALYYYISVCGYDFDTETTRDETVK